MFLPVWETNYSIKWPNPRRKLMEKVVNVEESPEVGLSPHINSSPPFSPTFLSPFLPLFSFLFAPFKFSAFHCLTLCIPCFPLLSVTFLYLSLPFSTFLLRNVCQSPPPLPPSWIQIETRLKKELILYSRRCGRYRWFWLP